ncbi:MAG: TetR family transcriptional regulator [Pseudomonadota bacterium]|nr:TetR family transcriptional regulator [Pseudomonadota bacterium]
MLAARDEFCRAGLAGAKLDVIAMQAEVSKQLIHHYFRTKTELYVAVVDETSALMIDELSRPSYEELPPVEALRLYFHGVFDVLVRWPFAAGLFIDESLYEAEHLPRCRELWQRGPVLMERLSNIYADGQRAGIFKAQINAQAAMGASIMVVIGCFTGGKVLSGFLATDFSTPDKFRFWRDFAPEFALSALRAVEMPKRP